MESQKINLIVNILVHVLILFTVLTFLFIFVVSKIAYNSFNGAVDSLVDDNFSTKLRELPPEQRQFISNVVTSIPSDRITMMLSQQDPIIVSHNNWVLAVAFIIIFILFLTIFLIVFILRKTSNIKVPIGHILFENFWIFSGVGIIEYLFFINIASKYIPQPPSVLVNNIVQDLQTSI